MYVYECGILQAASQERGPCLQGAGRASAGAAPLAGRAPLQAAAPPPQAPSETNAAHGGLYGARRQRVARLTLRGKFGGGRQGALMRGPPAAAAAARGGGGCGPGGNVSRALGRHPRAPPPLHLPRSDRGQVEEQEAPCSRPCSLPPCPTPFQEHCFSVPRRFLHKMEPTLLGWARGFSELIGALVARAPEAHDKGIGGSDSHSDFNSSK